MSTPQQQPPSLTVVQSTTAPSRPVIDVTGGDLAVQSDLVWRELMTANDSQHPDVMLRGDELTRLARDPEVQPGEPEVKLQAYVVDSLTDRMSRVMDFVRFSARFPQGQNVDPPTKLARILLNRSAVDLPNAPRVNRVTDIPVYGRDQDGEVSLVTEPGHSQVARVYYQPAPGLEVLKRPKWEADDDFAGGPRDADVQSAKAEILELIEEFPLDDDASRAHCVCMFIEPFVRELIGAAPTPLYVVTKAQPGIGASLLCDVLLYPGCGFVPPTALGADTTEQDKRILADLLKGPMAIYYDNQDQSKQVNSPALASCLTAAGGLWSGRVIGSSKKPTIPVRNVWVMTGNNINLHRELIRRSVPIVLGMKTKSEQEKYKLNLPDWAHQNRARLAQAAITLAEHYVQGHTEVDQYTGDMVTTHIAAKRLLDSYPAWARVMGGILAAAGIPGFLENKEKFATRADKDTQETIEFIRDWYDRTNGEMLRVDDLASRLQGAYVPPEGGQALPAVALPTELRVEREFTKVLSYWLRGKQDAVYGGFIVRQDDTGRHSTWGVEKLS